MMMKTEELLKVLDLPEDEQFNWIAKTFIKLPGDFHTLCTNKTGYLADLAFCLRDEVEELWWRCGIERVFQYCCPDTDSSTENENYYFISEASPIHWIIAALIAKELVNE